ncbi:MAG: sigma-54 factor interaction domain-containing protein [Candidatus Poribacteria bacterium]|nr:sigma-54 factor interaction domain-containing protein [Candidatus Poribacteria bacterium]
MLDKWDTFKTYATAPWAEEVAPSEMLLSREKLHGNYKDLIGESPRHLEVLKSIDMFAKSSKVVLISGKTGIGKELVARALHAESLYAMHPIVIVNCAGIAKNLIESELFGHEKGAFTGADNQHIGLFETASGGTLFLDEIGELPMSLQSKLLRVLQENEIRRVGGQNRFQWQYAFLQRRISTLYKRLKQIGFAEISMSD